MPIRTGSDFTTVLARKSPFPNANPRIKNGSGLQWNLVNMGKPNTNAVEATKGKAVLYRARANSTPYPSQAPDVVTQPGVKPLNATNLFQELYITVAEYGYQTEGTDAYAKYYKRYYPISSSLRTITITGIARDEREYEDLAYWIRVAQSDMATGYLSYVGLLVPEAGINAWGFIPSFDIKIGAQPGEAPNPIPVGITYQFQFLITTDNTDPTDGIVPAKDTSGWSKIPTGATWTTLVGFAGQNTPIFGANLPVNFGQSSHPPNRTTIPGPNSITIRV